MEYSYTVDGADRIVAVSDNWDDFANANDGADAQGRHVIGRSWSAFVAGREVHALVHTLLAQARRRQRPIAVPFRCDGPEVRRYMEMVLEPGPDASVHIRCRLLHEEPRPRVPLLDRRAPRTESLLRMCSWCARIHLGERWVELEEAVRALDLFGSEPVPALTHGLCERCLIDLELAPGRVEPTT